MGEIKLFQICFEGDLTVEVSHAMRRLGAEPNFDQSWQIWLPEGRHAAPLVRYLRSQLGEDARLLVACTQFTMARDFLLIRHSLTPGADYSELHDAIGRLGIVVELPFESTFIVQSDDPHRCADARSRLRRALPRRLADGHRRQSRLGILRRRRQPDARRGRTGGAAVPGVLRRDPLIRLRHLLPRKRGRRTRLRQRPSPREAGRGWREAPGEGRSLSAAPQDSAPAPAPSTAATRSASSRS